MSFNYDRYDRRQTAARTRSTFGYDSRDCALC